VYKKLYVEPEIGVRASSIPSQSIPFPAISMCPSTRVRKILKKFQELLKNFL
jgi:hypothetical protein